MFRAIGMVGALALAGCAAMPGAAQGQAAVEDAVPVPVCGEGDHDDLQVLELYQQAATGDDVFDVRLSCTNACEGTYFRIESTEVAAVNRQFLLLLTALQTGQTVDVNVAPSSQCTGAQGTPNRRARLRWVRLNKAGGPS